MVRSWLRAGTVFLAVGLAGCGGDPRESIISNTNNLVSEAATSASNIKNNVEEFVRKKGTDDEAAKKALNEAVAEAEKLEKTAKALQNQAARVGAMASLTDAEKKANEEKFKSRIDQTREELITSHREMKKVLESANANYEEQLRPLMQALSKAEGEFAAIARRR